MAKLSFTIILNFFIRNLSIGRPKNEHSQHMYKNIHSSFIVFRLHVHFIMIFSYSHVQKHAVCIIWNWVSVKFFVLHNSLCEVYLLILMIMLDYPDLYKYSWHYNVDCTKTGSFISEYCVDIQHIIVNRVKHKRATVKKYCCILCNFFKHCSLQEE